MSSVVLTNESAELRRLWHPIGRIESFGAQPQRIELLREAFAVVALDGDVRVFRDVCPHRFARLSDGRVVGSTIECPYHGWQFGPDGRCAHIPALGSEATLPNAQLESPRIRQQYGLVWVALDEPITDVLQIPEWGDPTLEKVWMPPVDINASAAQAIDNFLDFSHFPFVHAGTFGSDDDRLVGDFTTTRTDDGWGFVVEYDHLIDNHEDPLIATGAHPLTQPRRMRYDYRVPFSANLRLELTMTGMVNSIVMWCQPMSLERTRVHIVMLRNDCPTDADKQAAVDYEMRIFTEDLAVIEHLLNTSLPLERGQVHVRSDRHTVEFRRILRRLFD